MGNSFLGRRALLGAASLLVCSKFALADEPTVARFTLQVVSAGWVLDVEAPPQAVRAVLDKTRGDLGELSPQERRRVLSDYLRANVRLYFDGLPVRLTTINFLQEGDDARMRCPIRVPRTAPRKIRAELLAFNEVGRQQNLLRVEIPGGEGQVVASNKTGFVAEWVQGAEQFESPDVTEEPEVDGSDSLAALPTPGPSSPSPQASEERGSSLLGIVAATVLGATGVVLVFRRRNRSASPGEQPPQPGG